jgi:hypothetical protein
MYIAARDFRSPRVSYNRFPLEVDVEGWDDWSRKISGGIEELF